jgi:hypothetical protein
MRPRTSIRGALNPTLLFGKSQTFALHHTHTHTHTLASIGEVHFERIEGVETEADHRIFEQPVALTHGQENDNLNIQYTNMCLDNQRQILSKDL